MNDQQQYSADGCGAATMTRTAAIEAHRKKQQQQNRNNKGEEQLFSKPYVDWNRVFFACFRRPGGASIWSHFIDSRSILDGPPAERLQRWARARPIGHFMATYASIVFRGEAGSPSAGLVDAADKRICRNVVAAWRRNA